MNKTEYLEKLGQRLKSLPPGEVRDALDYYDGYISDSGDENAAIAQLGAPDTVAAQILSNYVTWRNSEEMPRGKGLGVKSVWGIILVLLSPVALPLAAAAVVLALAVFVCIFMLGVSGGMSIVAGIVGLAAVPFVFFQHFGYTLALIGAGLLAIGLGLVLLETTKALWRAGVNGLVKISGSLNRKRGK